MPKKDDIIEPIDDDFENVVESVISPKKTLKEITSNSKKISILAQNSSSKEISSQISLDYGIEVEREVDGIGMGVLGDGTPYLNQRGLAALYGVQNAHIGTISSQWNETPQKPRVESIKRILEKAGFLRPRESVYSIGAKLRSLKSIVTSRLLIAFSTSLCALPKRSATSNDETMNHGRAIYGAKKWRCPRVKANTRTAK